MNLLELKVSFPIKTLGSAAPKATEEPGFWFLRNSALVTREGKVSLEEVSGTRRISMKLAGTFWVRKKNTPWIKQGKWELRSRCYQIQPRHLVRSFETFSHGSNAYLLHFFGSMAKWFGALAQNSQGFCCCCVLQQINKLEEIVFLKFTVTSPFGREGDYNFLYVPFAFLILFPKGFHDKFYRAVD